MECECNMYKRLHVCWHTGYKPTFAEKARYLDDLPDAVKKSRSRLMSKEELETRRIFLTPQEYNDYLSGKRKLNVR